MSRRASVVALVPLAALVAAGCGDQSSQSFQSVGSAIKPAAARDRADPPAAADAAPVAGGKPAAAAGEPIARKIIYTATVEVVVKDLGEARKQVERIVDERKGYVAKSDVSGSVGSRRTATWTLKVPADTFRDTVASLAALGEPVKNAADSQDVTEEFVDIQARVKNLKAEEEALNKILAEKAIRLEDYLKIREQIKNVRGDIERAEGRMKYLATMAALSTISLAAREDASYVPPTAPTFPNRVADTFDRSVAALTDFGKAVALFAVGLAPWLPLILVGLVAGRWLVRRLTAASGIELTRRPGVRPRQAHRVAEPVADPDPPAVARPPE